ncbi:hypothetical protein C6A85_12660, partial [Mycobacterium sp. ITM-2017-0098]
MVANKRAALGYLYCGSGCPANLPTADPAQPDDPEDYQDRAAPAAYRVRAGTLLLANTDLLEPTFRRSVI